MLRYAALVYSYVRDGNESDLAAIGDLRDRLLGNDVPIEELVGLHEAALRELKDLVDLETYDEFVTKTSTCLTELLVAYSYADQRRKEIRDRERRLDAERQRLEALGQMAGGVAHELNNLLQPILGMAELALEDVGPDNEIAESLGMIKECASHAATIVSGILTCVRKQSSPPSLVCLMPLVLRTIRFLGAILPSGVNLDFSMDPGLEQDQVLCEEAEFSQVLLNLFRNAADAMSGTGTIDILLQRRTNLLHGVPDDNSPAQFLCLHISDTGCGMPPDVAERIFQPFFTTKAPTKGTGLGLSVVMAILQSWNAIVDVETAPGAGTRISISFPVAVESADEAMQAAAMGR